MRSGSKILAAVAGAAVLVLGWGYWYAQTHTALSLRVEDYGLKTDRQAYGSPHDVTLELLGASSEPLAVARSVEPHGYILAEHPSREIGNCQQRVGGTAAPGDYADCYARLSAWAAQWAPLVRRAHVAVGPCKLRDLPVGVYASNSEWWLWWVPLPHVGGLPRRYVEFVIKLDSRACAGAGR